MRCPNCEASDQGTNAYCRRCGVWIDSSGKTVQKSSSSPRERMTAMVIFNAMSAVFALTAAISLYATYLGEPDAKWSIYLAGAFCLVIAVHQAISFAYALELKLRIGRKPKEEERRQPFADGGYTKRMLEERDWVTMAPDSVTESTTDLLPEPRGKRNQNRALPRPVLTRLLPVPVADERGRARGTVVEDHVRATGRVRVLQEPRSRAHVVDPHRLVAVAVPIARHRLHPGRAVGEDDVGRSGRIRVP